MDEKEKALSVPNPEFIWDKLRVIDIPDSVQDWFITSDSDRDIVIVMRSAGKFETRYLNIIGPNLLKLGSLRNLFLFKGKEAEEKAKQIFLNKMEEMA